ncbi:unnamed protein product [Allacma fusca]|uniref:Uncharacterized protein n=1 Tax=Allacma fusca TaxID=39272 RepID=A0A8J2JDM6_9HEXA|nr:unnamed protein product [Allacma fusca]
MAMSGSLIRNEDVDNDNTAAMRPGSPITLDDDIQAALTDVEDMEEHQLNNLTNQTFTNSLTVPGININNDDTAVTYPDMDALTDTELVTTENEDEDDVQDDEPEAPPELVVRLVEDYQNEQEGVVSVEDNMGEKMVMSHASRTHLPVYTKDEEGLTDVEDVEGDDDEFEVDIVDMDVAGSGPFIFEFPIIDDGNDVVTVSMLERANTEDEEAPEEVLTDVEDLETIGQGLLSAANRLFVQKSPNFSRSSTPATDEEYLSENRLLGLSVRARSITPSDMGEDRLYEDITDEEEFGPEGAAPTPTTTPTTTTTTTKVSHSLLVQEDPDGFLTDYEDLQDSGDNDSDPEEVQRSEAMEKASAEAAERIFNETSMAASSEVIYKEQSFDKDVEEVNTDDDEIHIQSVDSRRMTPRLVLYQAKNTLLVETDDEGNDGGVTDTEDMFVPDAETPSTSCQPDGFEQNGIITYTAEEEKMIDEMMESMHGSVEVKESEKNIEIDVAKTDRFLLAEVDECGPLTDVEDLEESGPSSRTKPLHLSLKNPGMENMDETGQVKIIISPSPGSPDVNGGGITGGVAKRRAKKKHRKNSRERDNLQAQLAAEFQSEKKNVMPNRMTCDTVHGKGVETRIEEEVPSKVSRGPSPPPFGPSSPVSSSTCASPQSKSSFLQQMQSQSPVTLYDPNELGVDGKPSPIHAEIKLLVRTSENGRESVEIRSLREVLVPNAASPPPAIATSPLASTVITTTTTPNLNPTPTFNSSILGSSSSCSSPELQNDDLSSDRTESPIFTQRLLVRIHEDAIPQPSETNAVTGGGDSRGDVVIQEIHFSDALPQDQPRDGEGSTEVLADGDFSSRAVPATEPSVRTSFEESVKSPVRERLIPIEKEGGGILRNNGAGSAGVEITEITDEDDIIEELAEVTEEDESESTVLSLDIRDERVTQPQPAVSHQEHVVTEIVEVPIEDVPIVKVPIEKVPIKEVSIEEVPIVEVPIVEVPIVEETLVKTRVEPKKIEITLPSSLPTDTPIEVLSRGQTELQQRADQLINELSSEASLPIRVVEPQVVERVQAQVSDIQGISDELDEIVEELQSKSLDTQARAQQGIQSLGETRGSDVEKMLQGVSLGQGQGQVEVRLQDRVDDLDDRLGAILTDTQGRLDDIQVELPEEIDEQFLERLEQLQRSRRGGSESEEVESDENDSQIEQDLAEVGKLGEEKISQVTRDGSQLESSSQVTRDELVPVGGGTDVTTSHTQAAAEAAHTAVNDVIEAALSTLNSQQVVLTLPTESPEVPVEEEVILPTQASPRSLKQHVRFEGFDKVEDNSDEERYSPSSSSSPPSSVENLRDATMTAEAGSTEMSAKVSKDSPSLPSISTKDSTKSTPENEGDKLPPTSTASTTSSVAKVPLRQSSSDSEEHSDSGADTK